MVHYRGISISLRSQYDIQRIPEYSAPGVPVVKPKTSESSFGSLQKHYSSNSPLGPLPLPLSRLNQKSSFSSFKLSNASSDNSCGSSTAEVYIPVLRGSQFWIVYDITPPKAPTHVNYYYFKLFVDSKCVLSWGVGKEEEWRGQTVFGLYDGGEDWRGRKVVEKRGFYFGKSDAREAFFDLKVFRSRARKRVAKEPASFKEFDLPQGSGLSLSSAGNVRKSEKSHRYFNYALMDPVDEPYVAFRYHYRTWEQLDVLGIQMRGSEDGDQDVKPPYELATSRSPTNERTNDLAHSSNVSPPFTPIRRLSVPPRKSLTLRPTTSHTEPSSPVKKASDSSVKDDKHGEELNTLITDAGLQEDRTPKREWTTPTPNVSPTKAGRAGSVRVLRDAVASALRRKKSSETL